MIDFHCHLDLYDNPSEVVAEINARGTYVLAVTTTPRAWAGTKKLVGNSKRIRVALGLHPELVTGTRDELPLFRYLLPETKYVGEVGIDGSPHLKATYAHQEMQFAQILKACSELGGRVLSIHTRRATAGAIDLLTEHPTAGVPVLHWFSGSIRELERATNLDCWFSVNPMMLLSSKGRSLIEMMPRERLLLETDAPFTSNEDGPLKPWDTSNLVSYLAKIWDIGHRDVLIALRSNLARLSTSQSPHLANTNALVREKRTSVQSQR